MRISVPAAWPLANRRLSWSLPKNIISGVSLAGQAAGGRASDLWAAASQRYHSMTYNKICVLESKSRILYCMLTPNTVYGYLGIIIINH
jgi:hypothetical protein